MTSPALSVPVSPVILHTVAPIDAVPLVIVPEADEDLSEIMGRTIWKLSSIPLCLIRKALIGPYSARFMGGNTAVNSHRWLPIPRTCVRPDTEVLLRLYEVDRKPVDTKPGLLGNVPLIFYARHC